MRAARAARRADIYTARTDNMTPCAIGSRRQRQPSPMKRRAIASAPGITRGNQSSRTRASPAKCVPSSPGRHSTIVSSTKDSTLCFPMPYPGFGVGRPPRATEVSMGPRMPMRGGKCSDQEEQLRKINGQPNKFKQTRKRPRSAMVQRSATAASSVPKTRRSMTSASTQGSVKPDRPRLFQAEGHTEVLHTCGGKSSEHGRQKQSMRPISAPVRRGQDARTLVALSRMVDGSQTSSDELRIMKWVVLRETYVDKLRGVVASSKECLKCAPQDVCSHSDAENGQEELFKLLVELLAVLRRTTVLIVEAVERWRGAEGRHPFMWGSSNYLVKVCHDLAFLARLPGLQEHLGLCIVHNPLLCHIKLDGGPALLPTYQGDGSTGNITMVGLKTGLLRCVTSKSLGVSPERLEMAVAVLYRELKQAGREVLGVAHAHRSTAHPTSSGEPAPNGTENDSRHGAGKVSAEPTSQKSQCHIRNVCHPPHSGNKLDGDSRQYPDCGINRGQIQKKTTGGTASRREKIDPRQPLVINPWDEHDGSVTSNIEIESNDGNRECGTSAREYPSQSSEEGKTARTTTHRGAQGLDHRCSSDRFKKDEKTSRQDADGEPRSSCDNHPVASETRATEAQLPKACSRHLCMGLCEGVAHDRCVQEWSPEISSGLPENIQVDYLSTADRNVSEISPFKAIHNMCDGLLNNLKASGLSGCSDSALMPSLEDDLCNSQQVNRDAILTSTHSRDLEAAKRTEWTSNAVSYQDQHSEIPKGNAHIEENRRVEDGYGTLRRMRVSSKQTDLNQRSPSFRETSWYMSQEDRSYEGFNTDWNGTVVHGRPEETQVRLFTAWAKRTRRRQEYREAKASMHNRCRQLRCALFTWRCYHTEAFKRRLAEAVVSQSSNSRDFFMRRTFSALRIQARGARAVARDRSIVVAMIVRLQKVAKARLRQAWRRYLAMSSRWDREKRYVAKDTPREDEQKARQENDMLSFENEGFKKFALGDSSGNESLASIGWVAQSVVTRETQSKVTSVARYTAHSALRKGLGVSPGKNIDAGSSNEEGMTARGERGTVSVKQFNDTMGIAVGRRDVGDSIEALPKGISRGLDVELTTVSLFKEVSNEKQLEGVKVRGTRTSPDGGEILLAASDFEGKKIIDVANATISVVDDRGARSTCATTNSIWYARRARREWRVSRIVDRSALIIQRSWRKRIRRRRAANQIIRAWRQRAQTLSRVLHEALITAAGEGDLRRAAVLLGKMTFDARARTRTNVSETERMMQNSVLTRRKLAMGAEDKERSTPRMTATLNEGGQGVAALAAARVGVSTAGPKGRMTTPLLVHSPTEVNARTKPGGMAPLHVALANDHHEVARLRIHSGPDVSMGDVNVATPLRLTAEEAGTVFQAVRRRGMRVIPQLVMENGADSYSTDSGSKSPEPIANDLRHADCDRLFDIMPKSRADSGGDDAPKQRPQPRVAGVDLPWKANRIIEKCEVESNCSRCSDEGCTQTLVRGPGGGVGSEGGVSVAAIDTQSRPAEAAEDGMEHYQVVQEPGVGTELFDWRMLYEGKDGSSIERADLQSEREACSSEAAAHEKILQVTNEGESIIANSTAGVKRVGPPRAELLGDCTRNPTEEGRGISARHGFEQSEPFEYMEHTTATDTDRSKLSGDVKEKNCDLHERSYEEISDIGLAVDVGEGFSEKYGRNPSSVGTHSQETFMGGEMVWHEGSNALIRKALAMKRGFRDEQHVMAYVQDTPAEEDTPAYIHGGWVGHGDIQICPSSTPAWPDEEQKGTPDVHYGSKLSCEHLGEAVASADTHIPHWDNGDNTSSEGAVADIPGNNDIEVDGRGRDIRESYLGANYPKKLAKRASRESADVKAIVGSTSNWVSLLDHTSGSWYYLDQDTGLTQWEKAPNLKAETVPNHEHHYSERWVRQGTTGTVEVVSV